VGRRCLHVLLLGCRYGAMRTGNEKQITAWVSRCVACLGELRPSGGEARHSEQVGKSQASLVQGQPIDV
jgi:hypothetical protein